MVILLPHSECTEAVERAAAAGMVSHLQHQLDIEDNSFGIVKFRNGAIATLRIASQAADGYGA